MIEGLKVTVAGTELEILCIQRSEWHYGRAKLYRDQADSMEKNQLDGMNNSSAGNPAAQLKEKARTHECDADELSFIAQHLVKTESYLLGREDLVKIGVTKSRY